VLKPRLIPPEELFIFKLFLWALHSQCGFILYARSARPLRRNAHLLTRLRNYLFSNYFCGRSILSADLFYPITFSIARFARHASINLLHKTIHTSLYQIIKHTLFLFYYFFFFLHYLRGCLQIAIFTLFFIQS